MTKKTILFSIIILMSFHINSQNDTDLPKEKMYVHTNANFYLTGEQILYSVYCLNSESNQLSEFSKIGYIEIINKDNKSISKQKIRLKNGRGFGDVFLTSNIKTGTYKVIGYTQWMRNYNQFFENTIYIINPFANRLKKADSLQPINFKSTTEKQSNYLSLKTDKITYNKREKAILYFNNLTDKNVSISVSRIDNFDKPINNSPFTFAQNYTESNQRNNTTFLPELKGELFQGKVTSPKNESLSNKKVGISFIGKNKITKISKTNKNGEFYFSIDKPYDAETAILEVLEEDSKHYKISLLSKESIEKKFTDFPPIYLTEDLKSLIQEKSKYIQIENAYKSVKPSKIKKNTLNKFVFENNSTKQIYHLDDYKRFKTIKEVAIEILNDVWLAEDNDNYKFHLRDVNLVSNTNIETLLIVDGFIVNNHSDFVYYDALKIKTIELIKEKYYYGSKIYQGIINVITFKNNFKPNVKKQNVFALLKPLDDKEYFHQNYSIKPQPNIPDFRTQLYWNPNVSKQIDHISFFTSDVAGKYKITIQGFSKEGVPIFENIYINVK